MTGKIFNQKGFTLVEIMMVVIIIGILAVLAIPRYQKYLLESKLAEVSITVGEVKQGMEKYYNSHNQQYASIAAVAGNVAIQQKLRIELGANDNFIYGVETLTANGKTGYKLIAELTAAGVSDFGGGTLVGDQVIYYFPAEINTDNENDEWLKGWYDEDFFD